MEPQLPNTFENSLEKGGHWIGKFLNWKVFLIIFAAVLVTEGYWAFKTLNQPSPKIQKAPPQVIPMAGLYLKTVKTDLNAGDNFNVDIQLATGGKNTDGTDVIIDFDPNFLSVDTPGKPVAPSKLYKDYPINKLEGSGKIILSGVSGESSSFSGTGILGSIKFKALKTGKTTISIEYKSGSTTDSNVIESKSARDILIAVKNLTLNIK